MPHLALLATISAMRATPLLLSPLPLTTPWQNYQTQMPRTPPVSLDYQWYLAPPSPPLLQFSSPSLPSAVHIHELSMSALAIIMAWLTYSFYSRCHMVWRRCWKGVHLPSGWKLLCSPADCKWRSWNHNLHWACAFGTQWLHCKLFIKQSEQSFASITSGVMQDCPDMFSKTQQHWSAIFLPSINNKLRQIGMAA